MDYLQQVIQAIKLNKGCVINTSTGEPEVVQAVGIFQDKKNEEVVRLFLDRPFMMKTIRLVDGVPYLENGTVGSSIVDFDLKNFEKSYDGVFGKLIAAKKVH